LAYEITTVALLATQRESSLSELRLRLA
jgi:hypothetical protein